MRQPERNNWIQAIQDHQEFDDTIPRFIVCSLHFNTTDIAISGKRKTISAGKIPSIFPNRNLDTVDRNVEEFGTEPENAISLDTEKAISNIESDDNNSIESWLTDFIEYDAVDENSLISSPTGFDAAESLTSE